MNEKFLRRAVDIAREVSRNGKNGPFGAVIAQNDIIISEGWNQVVETIDPTAHAEIMAIRKACQKLGRFDLTDCILYSSCEPCPMCFSAIYWARIHTVYYAASRIEAELAGFDDDFIYKELAAPMSQRQIPFIRMLAEEGNAVLKAWLVNPEKIPY